MRAPADVALRDATPADLPAIVAMRGAAEWSLHQWAMAWLVDEPTAPFVVAEERDGELVAMGSGIVYRPSLGFIGNMVVAESHRRRGLGSAILSTILDRLSAAGCTRFELNATEQGRPLYERHGFTSRGTSLPAGIARRALRRLGDGTPARPMSTDDLDRIVDYDPPRFGGDRSALLRLLATAGLARGFVVERGGALAGFAFLQHEERRLGPMLADTPGDAAGLVAAMFEAEPDLEDVRLNLPPDNGAGAEWLKRARVATAAWDGRMARGPDVPRRDDTIYQMTVGPLG